MCLEEESSWAQDDTAILGTQIVMLHLTKHEGKHSYLLRCHPNFRTEFSDDIHQP